jgi:hypothetical protein
MGDERRIQKHPTEVSLVTVGGERLSGNVFVHPYNPARAGREQPVDVMNSPDPYIPLETPDGILLVAKDAIVEVEYEDATETRNDGTLPLGVNVTLSITMSGGKPLSGALLVAGPVNTPRLLDFMNRAAMGNDRFLELHADGRVKLVNRTHIATIRTID